MAKIKLDKSFSTLVLTCITLLLANGCTHMYKQPIHEVVLAPSIEKIDLPVQLVVTDDFRNAKWEKMSMGDTFIMPIGENLVHHTVLLMKNVFTHPFIPNSENEPPRNNVEVTYILRPEVAFIEQSFGVTAFSEATTSIGIEWNLARTTGAQVWVETIKGVGVGKAGNIFTGEEHQKKRFKFALQDLFQKSQEAMLSSPLLRKLQ